MQTNPRVDVDWLSLWRPYKKQLSIQAQVPLILSFSSFFLPSLQENMTVTTITSLNQFHEAINTNEKVGV